MSKEGFKKTEGRLYRYYRDLKILNNIKVEIEELENQKDLIKNDIKETNVSIETGLNMGIAYEERVQTSPVGTCYAEQQMISQIEKLEREWAYIIKKILKKRAKMRSIEREISSLKYNLDTLREEDKRFLEWKYAEGKSVEWIADSLFGGARTTAYRKREELINNISQWSRI